MALNIPEGNNHVMPYLILQGAAKFSDFVQKVFGARETMRHMNNDESLMHGQVIIGDSTLMFADSTERYPPMTAGLFIYVADADETYRKALDAGCSSVMEPADQEYGRACGVKDQFGNTWWITGVR